MKNNYDYIAPVYDVLSKSVFGKAQIRVQVDLLAHVLPHSSILIVGGGTGWILEKLTQMYMQGLKITYVEKSKKMLALAQKRNCGANEVVFVHSAVEEYQSVAHYDVIMTAFLFDNFPLSLAALVFKKLHIQLEPTGYWLFADFSIKHPKGIFWKKALLKMMYAFFKWVCQIEARNLVDMECFFEQHFYKKVASYSSYKGFIKGTVYKKAAA